MRNRGPPIGELAPDFDDLPGLPVARAEMPVVERETGVALFSEPFSVGVYPHLLHAAQTMSHDDDRRIVPRRRIEPSSSHQAALSDANSMSSLLITFTLSLLSFTRRFLQASGSQGWSPSILDLGFDFVLAAANLALPSDVERDLFATGGPAFLNPSWRTLSIWSDSNVPCLKVVFSAGP